MTANAPLVIKRAHSAVGNSGLRMNANSAAAIDAAATSAGHDSGKFDQSSIPVRRDITASYAARERHDIVRTPRRDTVVPCGMRTSATMTFTTAIAN